MAKKSVSVKHYEIYTLRKTSLVKPKAGTQDELDSRLEDIAVFDDKALGEAYIAKLEASPNTKKSEQDVRYELVTSLVEVEPAQDGSNLPFNPAFEDTKVAKKPTKKGK